MSIEFRRPFNINNLIFIVKDGNILNCIFIIDLNFIILKFEFLRENLILSFFCDFDGKYDFRFPENVILQF